MAIVGNGVYTGQDENAKPALRVLAKNENGSPLLVNPLNNILGGISFDAIGFSYPDAYTEVFTYYKGGLSGELKATVTATYDSPSKKNLISLVKS